MAYIHELGGGRRVYLGNQGTQTNVTIITTSPGQQQQSSCSFQTGSWTSPPEFSQSAMGGVIKITTAQGEHFIQVQGASIGMTSGTMSPGTFQQMQTASSSSFSSMPSMEPMKPMEPMKMGDMQMSLDPMEMRMGNMEMRMGSPAVSTNPSAPTTRRFCSQCGKPVKPGDRFCSNCGHQLD